jgi:hypothetical protein
MKKILLLTPLLLLLWQCHKEKPYKLVKPRSYYPVYPGSSWKYLKNGKDTVLWKTSDNYVLHHYKTRNGQESETVAVPFLNGQPIYGYERVQHIDPPFGDYDELWPILSEQVGFHCERSWMDTRYGDFRERVTVTEAGTGPGNESYLIQRGYWVWGPNSTRRSTQKYVKDTGLVSYYIVDTVSTDTVYRLELLEHHIGNH